MSAAQRKKVLAIIATDRTFEQYDEVWVGKCLHCNTKLTVALDGRPVSQATIEHIIPKSAGGTEEVENLGIACAACNRSKAKLDRFGRGHAKLEEVIATLSTRRRERWRDPSAAP